MKNIWLELASKIIENEILMVKGPETKKWFDKMPNDFRAICPPKKPMVATDFRPVVGYVHHMRMTRLGIEGVLHAPRKYHRCPFYVLYDILNMPEQPFWLVLERK